MDNSIERLIKNHCNARKSWEAWCYLSGIDNDLYQTNTDTKKKVDNNPLLFHLRYLALKDFHIEFYKVLKESKRNKDSIFLILEKKISTNPKNNIALIEAIKSIKSLQSQINKICDIRDKFYAHLDKDYSDFLEDGIMVKDIHNLFYEVETAITLITSIDILQANLNLIESRMDFNLTH